jgi:rifampicin phosphotransferase
MPPLPIGAENGAPADGRSDQLVIGLHDVGADELHITGAKAAALAKAARAGLSTLPGWVLTTSFCDAVDAGEDVTNHPAVRDVYGRAGGDTRALVARSSSVVEDSAESSMAGRFESVIGIVGFDAFVKAVVTVLDSRGRAEATDHPIAVLVQPLIEPAFGGVLFGVDPVTGRSDRRVVFAVIGGPEPLVSGEVDGSRFVLDLSGKPVLTDTARGPSLPKEVLRRLSGLSSRVEEVFGSPQDVEWAVGTDGALWLLQSRPVTTAILGVPSGPIYGRGRSPKRSPNR